jgi:hypothetical protein
MALLPTLGEQSTAKIQEYKPRQLFKKYEIKIPA